MVEAISAAHENLAPGTGPFRAVRSHRCQRQPIASGVRPQSRRGQGLLPRWQRPPHACHADQSGQQGHRGDQLVRHPLRLAHEREPSHLRGQTRAPRRTSGSTTTGVCVTSTATPASLLLFRRPTAATCHRTSSSSPDADRPKTNSRTHASSGLRQVAAARTAFDAASDTVTGGVDSRIMYLDMANQVVSGKIHPRRTRAPHRSGRDRRGNERRKRRGRTGNPDLPRGPPETP